MFASLLGLVGRMLNASEAQVVQLSPHQRWSIQLTQAPAEHIVDRPLISRSGEQLGSLHLHLPVPIVQTAPASRMLEDAAQLALGLLENEKQRRQQEEELQTLHSRLHHAQLLAEVTSLAQRDLSPRAMIRTIADLIGTSIDVDWAGLATYRQGRLHFESSVYQPDINPAFLDLISRNEIGALGRDVTAQSLTTHGPLFVDDYPAHPAARQSLIDAHLQAGAWLPVGEYDGAFVAILVARIGRRHPWSTAERQLLLAAAQTVRIAVERQEHARQLRYAAFHDDLTGLHNRRCFDSDLTTACKEGKTFSLLMMDLDGFKQINDRFGHGEGDRVLTAVATALTRAAAADVKVYRLGGDEFAAIQPGRVSQHQLQVYLKEVMELLRGQRIQSVGMSCGLIWCPDEAQTAETAHRLVDHRMYQEKLSRGGGGR
ncbi:GGDEF domain-containing protein [Deinococcus sonorensis]|uniref:Diguanylate cyclase n=2 Tax=Deinococcus sonorensis TaxID=309891 RepID=A0AAU7U4W3_9DEIO